MAHDDGSVSEIVKTADLHFVGIAASAGGLEAISLLVKSLPLDIGAVYVLAQHMSPSHKSVLSSLIARETNLPVIDLDAEVTPQPNTIYITPPNTDVVLEDGKLLLKEPSGHNASPKPSGDRLFKSLASECVEKCVGIVLSGTGSDGSYGVQAIRESGGITIAQDLKTAKYDGMPGSAIRTGCVDLTLSPDLIGKHLFKILAQPRDWEALQPKGDEPKYLRDIFAILMARTNVDFNDYKPNTVNRRIARRMAALGIDSYDDYVSFCREDGDEVQALYRDLLISVTRFFRDIEQFDRLHRVLEDTIPRNSEAPVRVWVVGCATGEEAYSIAIVLLDLLGGPDPERKRPIQVFATDIDDHAIDIARRGTYPLSAAQDIPQRYLNKYFTVTDNEITVRPEVRSVTLFSRHNVFRDPPFINLHLVSIRNVMIYFNMALQERVLTRLHYSLGRLGLLFLGTSETVGEMSMFFERREEADKIYVKRRGSISSFLSDGRTPLPGATPGDPPADITQAKERQDPIQFAENSLFQAVAEAGLVCTRNGHIVEFIGDVTPFIRIQQGAASAPSLRMLIDPLQTEATSLISVAVRNGKRSKGRWHEVQTNVGNRAQLQVYPFTPGRGSETQFLISIETRFEELLELDASDGAAPSEYIRRMEAEVRSTQEALQLTIEELQTANEELQSTNEELLSTNEEFQATNEELETSNEELQSTNEELLTVNEELQVTSTERESLAAELEAILLSAPYPIAFADHSLVLRRASQAAYELFGFDPPPARGSHLSQAQLPKGFPPLAALANEVLRKRAAQILDIRSDGAQYRMIVAPVVDKNSKVLGVSLSIDQSKSEAIAATLELMAEPDEIGGFLFDIKSKELVCDVPLLKLLGESETDHMQTLEAFVSKFATEDRAALQNSLDTNVAKGTGFSAVLTLGERSVQLDCRTREDSAHKLSHLVGRLRPAGTA